MNSFCEIIAKGVQLILAEGLNKFIMETHYGFMSERSAVDAIFIVRRLQEYSQRKGERGLFVLLDWEKVFDKVFHECHSLALKSMNIPIERMRIIEGLYKNPRFYVEIEGIQSSIGKQETGIRQGCPLSPYLFILAMDRFFEIIPYIAKRTFGRTKSGISHTYERESARYVENLQSSGKRR